MPSEQLLRHPLPPNGSERKCATFETAFASVYHCAKIAMGADTSPHVPRFTVFDHRHQRRCLECAFSAPRPQYTPIRDSALRALLPACRLDLRHCGKRASEHIEEGHEVSAWHQPGLADHFSFVCLLFVPRFTADLRPLPHLGRDPCLLAAAVARNDTFLATA